AMRKRGAREVKRLIQSSQDRVRNAGFSRQQAAQAHHLYQYLHLTAALGGSPEPLAPHIQVTPIEVAAVQERFGFHRQPGGPLLFGLNAGAEYGPAKRWPRERFVETARALQLRTQCHWWIFGSQADHALAAEITAEIQTGGATPASAQCLA